MKLLFDEAFTAIKQTEKSMLVHFQPDKPQLCLWSRFEKFSPKVDLFQAFTSFELLLIELEVKKKQTGKKTQKKPPSWGLKLNN